MEIPDIEEFRQQLSADKLLVEEKSGVKLDDNRIVEVFKEQLAQKGNIEIFNNTIETISATSPAALAETMALSVNAENIWRDPIFISIILLTAAPYLSLKQAKKRKQGLVAKREKADVSDKKDSAYKIDNKPPAAQV